MAAVNRNMFDACVAVERPQGASLLVLPLNLIALIVASLDDPGDLARLCQTCRVLNYMALPQLYKNLTLTSYDKIRYRGEEPEGMGSASPFSMGLNAVITRPYASLVRSLTLRGDWRELELEEHARVGRVPDSSMMLNIAARAAVDRMSELQTFSWELSTKMLETVYLGLAQLPKLTSLTVRFPSSRHPRPTITIPAMPHLRYLKITDIDPLCYPDDISTLLWKARKLVELKLHWSPRMRNVQEPSVMLHDYFRKCTAAKYQIGIRKLGLQNLYARHSEEFNTAFDYTTVKEVTILNGTCSDASNTLNTFVDSTWPVIPRDRPVGLKSIRVDICSQRQVEFFAGFTGLEKIYFVSTTNPYEYINSPRQLAPPTTLTPPASEHTTSSHDLGTPSATTTRSNSPTLQASIRDSTLNSLVLNHAATLRHLLLPSRWPLPPNVMARLVHASPQLEQLSFAPEFSSMDTLGLLLPFLRNLKALRFLIPDGSAASGPETPCSLYVKPKPGMPHPKGATGPMHGPRSFAEFIALDDEVMAEKLGEALSDQQIFQHLKVFGIGRKGFLLGEYYTVPADQEQMGGGIQSQTPGASRATSADLNGSHERSPLGGPVGTSQQDQENGSGAGLLSPGSNSPKGHLQTPRKPPSLLGKRAREDDVSVVPSDQQEEEEEEPLAEMNEGTCFMTDPKRRSWRRRVRRVGWDVLKNWEIWGLDTQEL
ncbi:hypothetical protein ARAM_000462 [Aspergillus rambellii]|uniref:F-box domain-containing protein n=3 Tax=Aspergillus subgen. Nidulantes TaxID=2720870 RepID=A0A0F8V689_9EURO|nr:hypothetical protein AOCH_000201 [Aspergillus ochraceoroseus]KKK27339.1 hypothetical protein ARAM_000462 [Aspergillus rambellii]